MLNRLFLSFFFLITINVSYAAEDLQPLDRVVAIVNSKVITQSELTKQMHDIKQQLKQSDTAIPPSDVFQKQVLQHLIDVDLQLQAAKNAGVEVSDAQVDDAVKDIAKRNNISLKQLKKNIKEQDMDFTSYKENIKKEMIIANIQRQAAGADIEITPEQIDAFQKKLKEDTDANILFHVKDIVIPLPEAPSASKISAAKNRVDLILKKLNEGADFSDVAVAESSSETALGGGDLGWRRLDELPTVFSEPVKKLSEGDIANPIRTPNGFHIIKLVEKKGEPQKQMIKKTHVRHILLTVKENDNPEVIKSKLEQLRKEIQKGKDFAIVAKENSEDPMSAVKGGDLDWVQNGELVPPFENTMNSLPLKKLSKPVRTTYGWHLIEVLERKDVDGTQLLARQQAQQLLYRKKFNDAVHNWLQN